MKDFKDKVLVVTGGSSGIGKAIAREGALRGMKIVINGITKEHVEAAEAELKAMGAEVVSQLADISRLENVQALFDLAMEKFGRVDMLVNNAGVAVSGPIWEIPVQDIHWITEVNLMSHLYGMHIFIPQMIRQGTEAVIVNTASTAGLMTSGNAIMYHTTKHADLAASESCYLALKQRGLERIQVHCLVPAFVQTLIHKSDDRRPDRGGGSEVLYLYPSGVPGGSRGTGAEYGKRAESAVNGMTGGSDRSERNNRRFGPQ